jgi:hypothetical protein
LENALREAKTGEVIRILPGLYSGTFEIRQRNVKLYGATGVYLNSNLRISKKSAEVKQITFSKGNVEIVNETSGVDIINCMFSVGGIDLQGDNNDILISNCLLFGISARTNKRVSIKNSTILERPSGGNGDNDFAIKGYINGEFRNCLINASKNYVIRYTEKDKTSGSFKYCLLWAGKSLALMDKETVSDLKGFKKSVARLSSVIMEKPQFIAAVKGDYRLKDFSPGFVAGENKLSIGVQMGADLKLIDVK